MKPFFLLAILFSMLGAGHAVAQTSILAKDWVLQRPPVTAENLKSVAHNGTYNSTTNVITPATDFVAVGGHGTILTATDVSASYVWTINTVPTGVGDLRDVAFTGALGSNKYVAVGTLGTILTAPDTLSGTPAVLTWSKAGDSTFVATDAFNAVSTNAGIFVAAGVTAASTGVVMISQDSGSTWVRRLVPSTTELKDVALTTDSKIYVVMDGALLVSANFGLTWSRTSLTNTKVKSLAIALPAGQPTTLNITGDTNWQVSSATNVLAINTNTPTFPATTTVPAAGMPMTWSLNELVGILPTGSLYNSSDGVTWISISSTTNVTFTKAVKWANRSYLAVGNGGAIYSYVEGGAWTPLTAAGSTAFDALGVAWNERVDPTGSLTVAVGNNISWTSPDQGVTWTEHVQTAGNMNMISVMWSGSYFVAAGSGLWISTDGINWTSKATPPAPKVAGDPTVFTVARLYGDSGSTPFALAYDPTKKVVMYSKGDESGFGWNNPFLPVKGASTWAMLAITKKPDSSQYLAVGWGGHVLVTTNPSSTWTEYVAGLAAGEDFNDVIWANDQYTAVTSKGGIWTSVTGATWTKRHTAPQALWGVTRVKHPGGANDQFVAVGNHGAVVTSYEGRIWTDGTLPTSQYANQVIWMPACTTKKKVHSPSVSIATTTITTYSLDTNAHTLTTTVEVDTTTTTNFETTVETTLADDSPIIVTSPKATSQTVTTVKGTPSSTTTASTLSTAPSSTTSTTTTAGTPPPDVDTTPSSVERLLTVGGTGAFFASTGAAALQPTISFDVANSTTIVEGHSTTAININLSAAVSVPLTLTLDFSSSTLPASSYTASATSFSWVANSTDVKQLSITSINDGIDRNNGQVIIKIKSINITGADVGIGAHPTYTVTVTDDDFAPNSTVVASSPLVYAGSSVTFSAVPAANVVKAATWQWLKDGVAIPGATQPIYNIPAATLASAGNYSVRGTNSAGTRTSLAANLAVLDGSSSTQYRKSTSTAVLTVKTAGTGLSYQWFSTTAGIQSQQVLPTLTVIGDPQTGPTSTPSYYCQVTSGSTTLKSGVFTLIPLQSLTIAAVGSADFVKVGSPITFSASVTNPDAVGPVTWQWYKGTGYIPGATGQSYQIASATLASAGEYSVRAFTPAGKGVSNSFFLAVLDGSAKTIYAKHGSSPTLSFSVVGANLTQQWNDGSGTIPGAIFATYIASPASSTPAVYTCTLTSPGGTILTTGNIKVVETATSLKPTVQTSVFSPTQVGKTFSAVPTASNSPTSWVITGLPLGLDYNRSTGAVSGIPKAAGTFSLTLVASNGSGASAPSKSSIFVAPIPDGTAGTFMAILDADSAVNSGLGNRLDFTVATSGAFTGKLTSVSSSTAFFGNMVYAGGDYEGIVNLLGGIKLDIKISPSSGTISGTATKAAGSAAIHGWRKTAPGASLAGKYTIAYSLVPPLTIPVTPNPNGSGYGFVTVDAAGNLTMTGKMADGSPTPLATTAVTSAFVGPGGLSGIFLPLYNSSGSLQGTMTLTAKTAPAYEDNSVAGSFKSARIISPATTGTPITLTVDGGKYIAPKVGSVVMGLNGTSILVANAKLTFVGADVATAANVPDCSYAINAPAVVRVVGSNPANTTLGINASTGEFTGTFIRDATTTIPRYAGFFGVLIRPGGSETMVGRGFFFEQDTSSPPVTLVGAANLDKVVPAVP